LDFEEWASRLSDEVKNKLFDLMERRVRERLERARAEGELARKGRLPILQVLAEELGVGTTTIKAWKSHKWCATGENAVKLLKKTFELDPKGTLEILRSDAENYIKCIEKELNDYSV